MGFQQKKFPLSHHCIIGKRGPTQDIPTRPCVCLRWFLLSTMVITIFHHHLRNMFVIFSKHQTSKSKIPVPGIFEQTFPQFPLCQVACPLAIADIPSPQAPQGSTPLAGVGCYILPETEKNNELTAPWWFISFPFGIRPIIYSGVNLWTVSFREGTPVWHGLVFFAGCSCFFSVGSTLLRTNISFFQSMFEDDFPGGASVVPADSNSVVPADSVSVVPAAFWVVRSTTVPQWHLQQITYWRCRIAHAAYTSWSWWHWCCKKI